MRRVALLHTWWFAIASLFLVFGLDVSCGGTC